MLQFLSFVRKQCRYLISHSITMHLHPPTQMHQAFWDVSSCRMSQHRDTVSRVSCKTARHCRAWPDVLALALALCGAATHGLIEAFV